MDLNDYSQDLEIKNAGNYRSLAGTSAYFDTPYIPRRFSVSGIHRAIFEGNIHTVKLMVESGVSVNTEDSRHGFTPLHMAVIQNNLEVLEYLLSQDSVLVNAEYHDNVSPLHVAAQMGHIESVRKLIEGGANINLCDFGNDTPLHKSVLHPDVAHLLIQKGAHIDDVNCKGQTPLHCAALACCLETVCMLLYYNADVDTWDNDRDTPFMYPLFMGNVDIQRALFEYVNDFNESGALKLALELNTPLIGDMIERGADLNYGDDEDVGPKSSAFFNCIRWPECNTETFKLVWDRISFNETKKTIDCLSFFNTEFDIEEEGEEEVGYIDLTAEAIKNYLRVIIESDNFEPAVESFTANGNFRLFIGRFADYKLRLEQLTAFTCRLLQYGYRPTSRDVSAVFSRYGFCELLRILLYMDVDCSKGWPLSAVIPRMMFDLGYGLRGSEVVKLKKRVSLRLLEYFTCPELTRKWDKENERGDVPPLIELARDVARRHIWNSLRVKSTCQFYTAIDNFSIPSVLKKILTLESKLYVRKSIAYL